MKSLGNRVNLDCLSICSNIQMTLWLKSQKVVVTDLVTFDRYNV